MLSPSKRIISLIVFAVIIVGAVAANKFWPSKNDTALVIPEYSANSTGLKAATGDVNATAYLQSLIKAEDVATTTDETPDTPSRKIARSMFANTAMMNENGILNDTSKEAILNDALSQIQKAFSYKEYGAEGLSYLPNESEANLKLYGTKFAEAEINTIVDMQKNVTAIQSDLSVLGTIYAKYADIIYKIRIPQSMAENHLRIVNNLSKGGAAFNAFANSKNDPLVVPVAMRSYQDATTEQDALLRQVAQFLKSNGIIFTKDEAGGYWNAFQ